MLLLLLACSPLRCGPGTVEADKQCVPAADTGAPDSADTADTTDTTDTTDSADSTDTAPLELWLLAGQSNMDGYAYLSGLPPSFQTVEPGVPLYWSGWEAWRGLQPASYGGAAYVGPEVSFGRAMAAAGRPVGLVKHAVGGTDLAYYWNPGVDNTDAARGQGWRTFVQTMRHATDALDAAGTEWRWAGFLWMQGESDSLDATMASNYQANLSHLVARVREETDTPDLPAVIGLISRESVWTYADTVRAAQQAVADADSTVVTVETDDLPRNELDVAHYDGPSNRVLGARMAEAALAAADVPAGGAPAPAMVVTSWAQDYDFTGTCGWSFTLDRAVTVTDVGAFGPAGWLATSTDVGVWNADAELVLRANVPNIYENPTSWRDGFWYVAVEPTTLEPGEYRIGLVSWTGDADHYGNDAAGSMGEGFTFGAPVYVSGYWLAWPSQEAAGSGYSFVGPNLLTVPAAE